MLRAWELAVLDFDSAVLILSVDLPSRAILPNREPIPLSQSVEVGATAKDILSYWRFEKATHRVREMSILFIPLPFVQDDCNPTQSTARAKTQPRFRFRNRTPSSTKL